MKNTFIARDWPIVKAIQNNRLVMAITWHGVVWLDGIDQCGFSGHKIDGTEIVIPSWQIISYVIEGEK